jgi:hypothetical protein
MPPNIVDWPPCVQALFPDQPDKGDLYCPQQYLRNAQTSGDDNGQPPPHAAGTVIEFLFPRLRVSAAN